MLLLLLFTITVIIVLYRRLFSQKTSIGAGSDKTAMIWVHGEQLGRWVASAGGPYLMPDIVTPRIVFYRI